MKHQLLSILLTSASAFAAAEYDVTKGVDFNNYPTTTPTLLNSLVDMSTIKSGKGVVIASATAPDVQNNRRYTNFLWLDKSFSPPYLKYWSGTNDTGTWNSSTNWSLVTTPNSTITSNKIADFAITSSKIATNAINDSYMIEDGTIISADIADNTIIASNKLRLYSVGMSNIADNAILNRHIATNQITQDKVVWPFVTNIGMINSNVIADVVLGITTNAFNTNLLNGSNVIVGSMPASRIVPGSITNLQLSANAVLNTNIADGAINGRTVAAGSIDQTKLSGIALAQYGMYIVCRTNFSANAWSQTPTGDGFSYTTWGTDPHYNVMYITNACTSTGSGKISIVFSNALPTTNYSVSSVLGDSEVDHSGRDLTGVIKTTTHLTLTANAYWTDELNAVWILYILLPPQ